MFAMKNDSHNNSDRGCVVFYTIETNVQRRLVKSKTFLRQKIKP